MIVVSDTSVINYLVLIGYPDLLHYLFDAVAVPRAAYDELTCAAAPSMVRDWVLHRPDWLDVRTVDGTLALPDLHAGEREAISLAASLKADALLIDERKGSRVALAHGLSAIGTLNILEEAANRGLVALPEAVAKLRRTNFRISERILEDILARHP